MLLKAQFNDVNQISHAKEKRGLAAGAQRSANSSKAKKKKNQDRGTKQNQKEAEMERGIRIPPLFLCTQSRVLRGVWGLGSLSSSHFFTALLRGKKTGKKMRILQKKVIAKSPRRHNGFAVPKDPWDFYFLTRVFFGDQLQAGLNQIWLQVREGK